MSDGFILEKVLFFGTFFKNGMNSKAAFLIFLFILKTQADQLFHFELIKDFNIVTKISQFHYVPFSWQCPKVFL